MGKSAIIIFLYVTCFSSLFNFNTIYSLNTLEKAQHYTQHYPKYPKSDTGTYTNPTYKNFYKKKAPSLWQKIINYFRGTSIPYWSATEFEKLLINATKLQAKEYKSQVSLTVEPESTIIVWGDLHGAIHSLVSDLTHLYQRKIIDNNFKILDKNTYFVFDGNAINFSPYSLEILTLILTIKLNNPENVFYIGGQHETQEFWHNYTLASDLSIRVHKFVKQGMPLEFELREFFYRLPKLISINIKDSKDLFIIKYFEEVDVRDRANIKAVIQGEDTIKKYKDGNGLYLISTQGDIPAVWTIVSSPVWYYRMARDFHYDAYVQIDIKSSLEKSTISSFSNYLKDKYINFKERAYSLTTGKDKGKDPDIFAKKCREKFCVNNNKSK